MSASEQDDRRKQTEVTFDKSLNYNIFLDPDRSSQIINPMVGKKPVSIHEVAREVGFSIATVSNVLNGKGRVSAKTRKKVLAEADRMGYSPNSFGRQLRLQKHETVGLLFYPNCAQLFRSLNYVAIMAGVEESLDQHKYDLLLSSFERGNTPENGLPHLLQSRKVDGVILLGNFPEPNLRSLAETGLPLLLLDSQLDGINADSITTAGFSAGAMIARHLADFGHRRIAFVGFEKETTNANDRRRGFLSGLKEMGLPIAKSEIPVQLRGKDRFSELLKSLRSRRPPTALFVENDSLASKMMEFLRKQGFRIPKDLSVVGFDNSHYARLAKPALTTVGVDQQAMGRFGADAIVARIQNPQSPLRSFRLPVTLFERDSVGPPMV